MNQEIRLRWTSHQETILTIFQNLLTTETLVDVTLAAEGRFLKAHQVILAASSSFFQDVLSQSSCNEKHPIIFLKDVKYAELEALVSYMYKGEATILQDNLPSLLNVAQSLKIRGLFHNNPDRIDKKEQGPGSLHPPSISQQTPTIIENEQPEEDQSKVAITDHPEQNNTLFEMQDFEDSAEALVKAELGEDRTDEDSIPMCISLTLNSQSPQPADNYNRTIRSNTSDLNHLPQQLVGEEGSSIWTEKETYECPKCGKKYTSNKSLWRHRKFACEGKQSFACALCGKIFSRSDNLRRHAVVAHCAN